MGIDFFLLYMGVILAGGMTFPLTLVMQFLMPKAVLEQYWRVPYMRPMELVLFSGIYAPLRPVMLMWVIAFPRFGRKRGITAADRLAPRWYRTAAQVICVWILACCGINLILTAGVFIYGYATGNPVPLTRK